MKKQLLILLGVLTISAGMIIVQGPIGRESKVSETLMLLGEEKPDHYLEEVTAEMIWRGEELVKIGRTIGPNGSQGKYISKYYTCTSCHNLEREDQDLTVVDQKARLDYAIENQLPYLQGSTFWGMVNRETWYNDDYVLKYGDLVKKAENSLRESISLCATVCAQGRPLEDWEMESIVAYLWSLEMKLGDLDLSDKELDQIRSGSTSNETKIQLIKSKYLQKSPATFVDPPEDKVAGYPYEGDARLGKAIYELGCQHCHRPEGESGVIFDNTSLTYNWLVKNIPEHSEKSIYEIIRKGTYAEYGHKEYMPHYTLEKMSDQQIEHLRAFLENPVQ